MTTSGALMVAGTASDVGKSRLCAGLCRALVRRGVSVAPFKAQNMSLNSYVTLSGHEIGRSTAHQAFAARVEPEVSMNPVLLKPTSPTGSQLIVMGHARGVVTSQSLYTEHDELRDVVDEALAHLRTTYDVVILEGAGGVAEINLLDRDIVNLPLAARAKVPAILVGDIERGGVFASLYGSVALLPPELRATLGGFVINKFRGDESLLTSGIDELERLTGLPGLGVLPYIGELLVDGEDSMNVTTRHSESVSTNPLRVVVIRLPHMSNFTDFDPFLFESDLQLDFVTHPGAIRGVDLVVIPGSKSTIEDLEWMRRRGLSEAIVSAHHMGVAILGLCAGYQMLGETIRDGIESRIEVSFGLGLLPTKTTFTSPKVLRRRRGVDEGGRSVEGYQIHHGRVLSDDSNFWLRLIDESDVEGEGIRDIERGVWATTVHGIFESDELRRNFLSEIAARQAKNFVASDRPFHTWRENEVNAMANVLEAHLNVEVLLELIEHAGDHS